jgi:hypothetical protein
MRTRSHTFSRSCSQQQCRAETHSAATLDFCFAEVHTGVSPSDTRVFLVCCAVCSPLLLLSLLSPALAAALGAVPPTMTDRAQPAAAAGSTATAAPVPSQQAGATGNSSSTAAAVSLQPAAGESAAAATAAAASAAAASHAAAGDVAAAPRGASKTGRRQQQQPQPRAVPPVAAAAPPAGALPGVGSVPCSTAAAAWAKLQPDVLWRALLEPDAATLRALLAAHYSTEAELDQLLFDGSRRNVLALAARLQPDAPPADKVAARGVIVAAWKAAQSRPQTQSLLSPESERDSDSDDSPAEVVAAPPTPRRSSRVTRPPAPAAPAARAEPAPARRKLVPSSAHPVDTVLTSLSRPEWSAPPPAARGEHAGGRRAKSPSYRHGRRGHTSSEEDSASDGASYSGRARGGSDRRRTSALQPSAGDRLRGRPVLPSSSSDSGEDDDVHRSSEAAMRDFASSGTRHRHAVEDSLDAAGHAGSVAGDFLRNVLAVGPSVHHVFRYEVEFKQVRNRRECLALARIVDALRARDRAEALERAVRRLSGVHAADQSNDWDYCDEVEQVHSNTSFLPDDFLRRTVNNVLRHKAINKASKANSGHPKADHSKKGGKRSGGRGGDAGRRDHSRDRSSTGAAPSASNKKNGGSRGGSSKE